MGIKFYCPNGHKMNVKGFLAGQKGICPRCGVSFEIPQASTDTPLAPQARVHGSSAAPAQAPPSKGIAESGFAAHAASPEAVPAARAPALKSQSDSSSGSTPRIGILRWTTDAREPFGEKHPEIIPNAAEVHRTRRRSRRSTIARVSLIMLGIVAFLGAVLLIMLVSR